MKKTIQIIAIILFPTFFLSLTNNKEKKYLPVYIRIANEFPLKNELILNLKLAFKAKKISTINKGDMEGYIRSEMQRVLEPYYANGGSMDFNKMNNYFTQNSYYLVNSLSLDMNIDSIGNISEKIKWTNFPQPMKISEKIKPFTGSFIPDSTQSINLNHFANCIVDSIIKSNVLLKDE